MIEGISDCYNTQASCLISNFRRNVPAYRYSFPEMIVYEGMHNGCWWPDKAVANITNAYKDGLRFELVWKIRLRRNHENRPSAGQSDENCQ